MSALRLVFFISIVTSLFVAPNFAAPLNTTVLLQNIPGTEFSNHGNSKLLCRRARWYDVAIFFFGNYLAHAATVRSDPGQSLFKSCYHLILALLIPTAGVHRGILAIISGAIFEKTSLLTALEAGALCQPFSDPDKESFSKYMTQNIYFGLIKQRQSRQLL